MLIGQVGTSKGVIACECIGNSKKSEDDPYSLRFWFKRCIDTSKLESKLDTLNLSQPDIIIPMQQRLVNLIITVSNRTKDFIDVVCVYATSQQMIRLGLQYSFQTKQCTYVHSNEASNYSCSDNLRLNTTGSLFIASYKGTKLNYLSIGLWSDSLDLLKVLNPFESTKEEEKLEASMFRSLVGLEFGGEDEQYVLACYTSGIVMGWDIVKSSLLSLLDTSIVGISAVIQAPHIFSTYTTNAAVSQHTYQGKNTAITGIVVGYPDGKLRIFELFSTEQNSNSSARQEQQQSEWIGGRERGVIDLAKELRFRDVSVEDALERIEAPSLVPISGAVANTTTVLAIHTLPTSVTARSSSSSSISKKPSSELKKDHCSPAGTSGELCIVTPTAVCFASLQTLKVLHTLSLEEDFCLGSVVTAAQCSILQQPHESSDSIASDSLLSVVIQCGIAGGGGVIHTCFLPLSPWKYASNVRDAHTKDVSDVSSGIADLSISPRPEGMAASQSRSRSIYDDLNIPLRYFMHPSMLLLEEEEAIIEGEGETGVLQQRRRSLLIAPSSSNSNAKLPPAGSRRATTTTSSGGWEVPKKDKQGKLLDQPITFQKKIRSSGYGQVPQDSYERKKFMQQQQEKLKKLNSEKAALKRSLSAPRQGRTDTTNATTTASSMMLQDKGAHIRQYPMDCGPVQVYQSDRDIRILPTSSSSSSSPIYNIAYSSDGSWLGMATADSAVLAVRLPTSKHGGEVLSYAGHDSRVNNVCFSHSRYLPTSCGGDLLVEKHPSTSGSSGSVRKSKPMLLPSQNQKNYQFFSSSADGTARMWRLHNYDRAGVVFEHYQHSISTASSATSTTPTMSILKNKSATSSTKHTGSGAASSVKSMQQQQGNSSASTFGATSHKTTRNRPYGEAVTHAGYYYMDRFAVLTIKASIQMYQYNMHSEEADNDLKRTLAQGCYRRLHQWDFSAQTQNITATAFINSVHSPLIFTATTDKYLTILDASVGAVARTVLSPHTRSIHSIALPCPSVHIPATPDAYNCFLTAACDSNIHLWDLRAPSSLAIFNTHQNRREPLTCDISPCMRYIATGSEDKTTIIYDIRTGRILNKFMGAKDVVKCVKYHPLCAQLAAGSYDGTVRFYADPHFCFA